VGLGLALAGLLAGRLRTALDRWAARVDAVVAVDDVAVDLGGLGLTGLRLATRDGGYGLGARGARRVDLPALVAGRPVAVRARVEGPRLVVVRREAAVALAARLARARAATAGSEADRPAGLAQRLRLERLAFEDGWLGRDAAADGPAFSLWRARASCCPPRTAGAGGWGPSGAHGSGRSRLRPRSRPAWTRRPARGRSTSPSTRRWRYRPSWQAYRPRYPWPSAVSPCRRTAG